MIKLSHINKDFRNDFEYIKPKLLSDANFIIDNLKSELDIDKSNTCITKAFYGQRVQGYQYDIFETSREIIFGILDDVPEGAEEKLIFLKYPDGHWKALWLKTDAPWIGRKKVGNLSLFLLYQLLQLRN